MTNTPIILDIGNNLMSTILLTAAPLTLVVLVWALRR